MNFIVNDKDYVVDDMLTGLVAAYPNILKTTENKRVISFTEAPLKGKVGIVTGGGSGHKPAFVGYIGKNMCDSVAVGEIFSSPTAKAFLAAFQAADSGRGVACLYGNYAGDNMNVKMAIKEAEAKGINVKTVVANDDCASAPLKEREKRRGGAGEVIMWKVAGAKAAMGCDLNEVIRIAQKAIDNTRSIGVGIAPCTIPAVGHPNFIIDEGKMEIGIGHHGEPGTTVEDIKPAREIAQIMVSKILNDMPINTQEEVFILLSGLGATTALEEYIIYGEIKRIFEKKHIHVYDCLVGNYFTSLEMRGVTLTVTKVDQELKECLEYPVNSMAWRRRL